MKVTSAQPGAARAGELGERESRLERGERRIQQRGQLSALFRQRTTEAQRAQRQHREANEKGEFVAQSGLDLGREFSPFPAPALLRSLRQRHGSINSLAPVSLFCLLCASSVPAHFGLGLCGSLGDVCRIPCPPCRSGASPLSRHGQAWRWSSGGSSAVSDS
jgi:hypothetical protein